MRKINPTWFIVAGAILLIIGIGGSVLSVAGVFGVSIGSYDEWERSLPDAGFAPLAIPVSAAEELGAIDLPTATPSEIRSPEILPTQDPAEEGLENDPMQVATPTTVPTRAAVIPDHIIIPSIGLDAPIVPSKPKETKIGGIAYEQWIAPTKFAVGWHTTSAVIGQAGNTVLNGHHNTDGMVFENLNRVEPGAEIIISGGSVLYRYRVVNVMILPERNVDVETRLENARWILPSKDERVTLVTCWPAWSNTHRVVVVAQPVGDAEMIVERTPAPTKQPE